VPGYVQWTRACRAVDPAVLAGVRFGREAMHEKQAYLLIDSGRRGQVWWIDHYYVPVDVRWPGFGNPVRPVQTTVMDDCTRLVVATVLWPKAPTAEQVVAAVARAVHGFVDPDGVRHAGAPATLRMDNGNELIGAEMTEALLRLRIAAEPVRPRGAWEKGKLERWHRTLGAECFSAETGWTGGPRDYENRPMLLAPTDELPSRDQLRAHLDAWIAHYNFQRPHDGLDGRTPFAAWTDDATPLRQLPDDLLRTAMLATKRRVRKEGVRLHDIPYLHPQLTRNGAREVEVRYLPDELGFVDAALPNGTWVRCVPQGQLDASAEAELMRQRHEQEREVTVITRQARQLRRERGADRTATDETRTPGVAGVEPSEPAKPTKTRAKRASRQKAEPVERTTPVPPVAAAAADLVATALARPPRHRRESA